MALLYDLQPATKSSIRFSVRRPWLFSINFDDLIRNHLAMYISTSSLCITTPLNFNMDTEKRDGLEHVSSLKLTYHPKKALLKMMSISQGGICEFRGGFFFQISYPAIFGLPDYPSKNPHSPTKLMTNILLAPTSQLLPSSCPNVSTWR